MTIVLFTVRGEPIPQGSARAFVRGGRPIVTSDNPRLSAWRDAIAAEAAQAMTGPMVLGAVAVRVSFYLPRPKGHYGKRGLLPSAPRYHVTKPDVDKLIRAVLDGITGIVVKDDSQVIYVEGHKSYGDTLGARVDVWESEPWTGEVAA